jgi:DNA-binding LacI/PurR family transcriptional regulator
MSVARATRRRGRKAPSILDVAAPAAVAKSTASNIVRGVEVSDATRARVLGAIGRLNYEPNAIARQFVEQSTGTAGPQGGRVATEHLLALGHRRTSYVRTPLVKRSGDRARYAG